MADGGQEGSGSPPPPPRAGLCYLFPRSGQQTGSRACVILGGPACGLESTEGQVDHNGRGGRGEEQWAEETRVGWAHLHSSALEVCTHPTAAHGRPECGLMGKALTPLASTTSDDHQGCLYI